MEFPANDMRQVSGEPKAEVDLITLDEAAGQLGIGEVDILKIDVEGHEMATLRGAEALLSRTKSVQFEFGGTMLDARCFMKDFHRFFVERGFSVSRLTTMGLWPMPVYWESHEAFDCGNYIAHR